MVTAAADAAGDLVRGLFVRTGREDWARGLGETVLGVGVASRWLIAC